MVICPLLCKQKALYVKCCVIANGVTDTQGDTLYPEDIKKIFTSFNNQDNFEIHHNDLPLQEVSLLENYISKADETIGTAIVPAGSWMAVIRVDNPDIQKGLLAGEFKGVSLSNRIAEKCRANLHGTVRYQDIADAECVIPIFISFVEAGANGYGLHVMDYDVYIKKSKSISIKERSKNTMAFDLLGGLKKLVQQAEADNEPIIVKEDPKEEDEPVEKPTENEASDDETIKKEDAEESEEKEKEDEEPTVEKAEEEPQDEDDEAETTEEAETDLEARVAALEEKIAELLKEDAEEEEVSEETTEEPVDEDTPKITKSRKELGHTEPTIIQNSTYFDMSGRDPVTGCKIRK